MRSLHYEDILAWANQQAMLLREGKFDQVDVENVAEEIESLAMSDRYELAHRVAMLLSHLLKWRYQPARRCQSWRNAIRCERKTVREMFSGYSTLNLVMENSEWFSDVWSDAIDEAVHQADLDYDLLASDRSWSIAQILDEDFLPE